MAVYGTGVIGFAVLICVMLIVYSPALLPYLRFRQISLRGLLVLVAICAVVAVAYPSVFPKPTPVFKPEGHLMKGTSELPPCSVYWFRDSNEKVVSGFVAFGSNLPVIMISGEHGDIRVSSISPERILIPQDGLLYVLDPMLKLHKTNVLVSKVAADWRRYDYWGETLDEALAEHQWQ